MKDLLRGLIPLAPLICLIFASLVPEARAGVVFSEIMYHPVDATNAPVDGDEYEFLELYNSGPATVDLSGAQFTSGITYTFAAATVIAPGDYLILVRNRAAFALRYPVSTNLASGAYTGNLSNAGEKLTLKSASSVTLYSVTYGTSGLWTDWADGHGCSLQLRDSSGTANDPANWGASARFNGTPGETGTVTQADVVVNEVLSHTDPPQEDAIELYNVTTNSVDISGWFLSNQSSIRKKFQITNTVIQAHGYAVFYEYQFNNTNAPPGTNIAFNLSSWQGDRVYLTAADPQGNLTRNVDIVAFGPSENGVSFGRYPNGTGALMTMNSVTLGTTNPTTLAVFRTGKGASNSLPKVGPIVISEIMYHPVNDSDADEYIELLNVSSNTVTLFDGLHPSNTWKLSTAVDFVFPPSISMQPGERVLIAGATNLTVFRASSGVPSSVQVLGPWIGKLDNAGESVRLHKPDNPNPEDGFVPYILVDQVDYLDAAPWPTTPDGQGPSLERMVATNYANVSLNWYGGSPGGSPGKASAGGFLNPAISPPAPAAGQAVTTTVTVVTQGASPTQVVVRISVQGVETNIIMRDNGIAPDVTTNDHIYTALLPAQPGATWVYYRFMASSTGAAPFSLPTTSIQYLPSPSLTVRMSSGGLATTVAPVAQWVTYTNTGTATHTNSLYYYLNGSGEVLVDDVSFVANGSERVVNGGYDTTFSGNWYTQGTHSNSSREMLLPESNYVAHVIATGPGGPGQNVYTKLNPTVSIGQVCTLQFRTRLASKAVTNWFSYPVGTPSRDPVINEIMYHPAVTNEEPFEYVELYNPSSEAVDLSSWRLDGTGLTLPPGTSIGASRYLVCCASTSTMTSLYGITNVVGNWPGKLKNSNETLQLVNPYGRVVDEVTYGDKEPWPSAADGQGPSLERINPLLPGNPSMNWTASYSSTNWQSVIWTQQAASASLELSFWLDYEGKCYVDDVSVTPLGSSSNLLRNGDFTLGTNGWKLLGNHAWSRVKEGSGRGGGAALAVAGNVTRVVDSESEIISFGDAVSNCISSESIALATGTNYEYRLWVRRSGLAGTLFVQSGAQTNILMMGSLGTPGASNSIAPVPTLLGIAWVTPGGTICATGTANTIRAQVIPSGPNITAQVCYRAFASNQYDFCEESYSNVVMRDDGIAPDTLASDGIYAATMPTINANGVFVRYHVEAQNTNGVTLRSPHSDSPESDYAYWVQSVTPQTHLPNWTLFVDGDPLLYPITRRACAVSPNGQTFTDVQVRHRGYPDPDDHAAFSLRFNNEHPLDAWFADNQESINFRHRGNDSLWYYIRVINEPLAYQLQGDFGIPIVRLRHVCLWINGQPTITTEMENAGAAFIEDNGIDQDDYISKNSWHGRETVGGNTLLDNYDDVYALLNTVADPDKEATVDVNVWYEAMQHILALLSSTGNADQSFRGNVFQHRRGYDARWWYYPSDLDGVFSTNYITLHPYYSTHDFPYIYAAPPAGRPLAQTLFYSTNSIYTLPFRHRQQMTLWRYCWTVLTTNNLYSRIDKLVTDLTPAYLQINNSTNNLQRQANMVKQFIKDRRDYFINTSWPDKDEAIWAATNVYNPSGLVINELMVSPVSGGEYIEILNTRTQTVDLSQWRMTIGDESYRIPWGTMIAPTSCLVLADRQMELTNTYSELSQSGYLRRHSGAPLWDESLVWTSAQEYVTRLVEIPQLSLPISGATIELRDWCSNLVDQVVYSSLLPWPTNTGSAIELLDPSSDNSQGIAWRTSRIGGTPGMFNAEAEDTDQDGMDDQWERRIMSASGGTLTSVVQVLPGDDSDHDGVSNEQEFIAGTDPAISDADLLRLHIHPANNAIVVGFTNFPLAGTTYPLYLSRNYTLGEAAGLTSPHTWAQSTNPPEWIASAPYFMVTNQLSATQAFYRFKVRLIPRR